MSEKTPYFKPTRRMHNSGFRMFEYGYCEIDKKCNAINIEKVGEYDIFMDRDIPINHLDVTRNGYIRILNHNKPKWDNYFSFRFKRTK